MFVFYIFPVKLFTIIYLKFPSKVNKHFFVLSEQFLTTALYLINEESNTIICAKYIYKFSFLCFVLYSNFDFQTCGWDEQEWFKKYIRLCRRICNDSW